MKIKVNIPNFGERYCSNNVEYKLYYNGYSYLFYKKGTNIIHYEYLHNEYGPTYEDKEGSYSYYINNKLHRFNNHAYYNNKIKSGAYYVLGRPIGKTKENFIKNLANILIPLYF